MYSDNEPGNLEGEFYSPQTLPYEIRPDYQRFINHTNGILSIQIQDALKNIITLAPSLHAEELLLAGENVMWLPRIISGQQCPNWNSIDDQCTVSKCSICYGTGYYGGFGSPIFLKMSVIPGRADVEIEQAGLTITQHPHAWTIVTSPLIAARDMVVTFKNERYEVHAVEAADKQGRRMYQDLTLSRIDREDVKNYVPVPGFGGNAFTDFQASLTILGPHTDFPATITIKNYLFYGADGLTDNQNWDSN